MNMVVTSVADIRTGPSSTSERNSQLIYGEKVNLIEEGKEFSKVQGIDGVIGFIKSSVLGEFMERKYKIRRHFMSDKMALSFGSLVSDKDVEAFGIDPSYLVPLHSHFVAADLATEFIGIPYLWGGTSDFGFDCSGFVQRLLRFSNHEIPRNSDQQRDASRTVNNFEGAVPGDFVFFKGHVAFYLGNGKIVHANGHFSRVTENNLFDGSEYSESLLEIVEKIGRFPARK